MANVTAVINGRRYNWTFGSDGSMLLNDQPLHAEVLKASSDSYTVSINGKIYRGMISRNSFNYSILIGGKKYNLEIESSTKKSQSIGNNHDRNTGSQIEVRAPMPGMVVRCEVQEGARIALGDGLLILEAMKMENEIRAARGGIIRGILVKERQIVDKGELLVIIE
jgi:biotin carboxyl carrier protein